MLVDNDATPIKVYQRFTFKERIVAQYSLSITGCLVFLYTLGECHFPQFLLHALWHRLNRIQTLRQYGESIKQHCSLFAFCDRQPNTEVVYQSLASLQHLEVGSDKLGLAVDWVG